MKRRTLERRLELLRLEGNGLQPSEIVKELSMKYCVTPRAVWQDFETRSSWQLTMEKTEEALLKVRNRHEQLYRKASIANMKAKSDRTQIAALNLMRKINSDIAELTGAKSQKPTLEETTIKWADPKECKKQY